MSKDNNNSQDLLNDAIREASGAPATTRRPTSAQPTAAPANDLRNVLNELSGVASAADSSQVGNQAAQRLSDVVLETHVEGTTTDTESTSGRHQRWRRLGLRSLAVILMLVAAVFWWSTNPPPGPASTLQTLAHAVEQYRSAHNGALPKELNALESFPKNAVEWPLRYWKARDAAGRTEIIWVPQSAGHYRILLRQGKEVWTVTDREVKPKLATKGSP